ncbi:hypothetical protein [Laspinema olomoucense]|uniref:hypothetical protein n=1 Tax=Laspinema olomoucense TaxID=3231600 RepID=UPI0021BB1B61|nr:hypothetical protein [Laspinema sp. D3d]MCT7972735.1 hypothetical protein [Laspinema sp. D3d]
MSLRLIMGDLGWVKPYYFGRFGVIFLWKINPETTKVRTLNWGFDGLIWGC